MGLHSIYKSVYTAAVPMREFHLQTASVININCPFRTIHVTSLSTNVHIKPLFPEPWIPPLNKRVAEQKKNPDRQNESSIGWPPSARCRRRHTGVFSCLLPTPAIVQRAAPPKLAQPSGQPSGSSQAAAGAMQQRDAAAADAGFACQRRHQQRQRITQKNSAKHQLRHDIGGLENHFGFREAFAQLF